MTLADRHIVLGISGSIAAFKAADLASKLVQEGALVDVVMTREAAEFVTPLTFRALTGRPALSDMFQPATEQREEHVALARSADLVLIAPASANTLAKLVHGFADDMVALTVLATKAPVAVAPAMDAQMWEAAATQANVAVLRERGVTVVGPDDGHLASGHTGPGRLVAVETLVGAAKWVLGRGGALAGRRIVVSAGGMREPIDPVRFIGNRSSGKMGFALAEAARDRGAAVTLVTTVTPPPALTAPFGVDVVPVETVAETREAVLAACDGADVLIMAAAMADYRPATRAAQKIKKDDGAGLTLELVQNASFFPEVPDGVVKVGFAAETENLIANARLKTRTHGPLDLICANDVTAPDAGFGSDTNRVTILDRDGGSEELPLLSKYEVGGRILDRVAALLASRR